MIHFHAVSPEKLGQHFLTDESWQEQLADAIQLDGGVWVEIGAGRGEMTLRLAEHARKVFAIELDPRLTSSLRKITAGHKNIEVLHEDVLATDFAKLARDGKFSVYGSLPYYITSPILHRLFEHAEHIAAIHVVIQLEVAERIVSPPGRRDYGYLSVAAQWYTTPEMVLRIPPDAFDPPPQVDSALVSLRIPGARATVNVADELLFLAFVKECFAQKRKTLRNNLRGRLASGTEEILREAGLLSDARAEQLSIEQFANLYQRVMQPR